MDRSAGSDARLQIGGALAFMTYGYAAGRLLGVLLAASLIVFIRRVPFRDIAAAWLTYALLLLPLGLYELRHPSGLSARYHQTTFVTSGMSKTDDRRPRCVELAPGCQPCSIGSSATEIPSRTPTSGRGSSSRSRCCWHSGESSASSRGATRDRWWLWVLLGLLLASIPAALTPDRHDTLRLAALPVFYLLLASLGLHWLMTRPRRRVVTVALAVAAAALFAQWAYFVDEYSSHGPSRTALFDADVPRLLQRAFSGGATVYMDHDDRYAETQARWYALTHHIDRARVSVLPDGGFAPPGAMVFGRTQACDYACSSASRRPTHSGSRARTPRTRRDVFRAKTARRADQLGAGRGRANTCRPRFTRPVSRARAP